MAYQMKIDGMAEISELLDKIDREAPKAAARAVYEGAGIMSAEIRREAESIRTAPFKFARAGETRLPSPEEKAAVIAAGAGIAKFDKNGTEVDTSVGFRNTGYTEINGKKRPVPAIVNAINSGTSFMQPQPFVRRASKNGGPKAMAKMRETIEQAFEEISKK